ncbi:hypothetical protein PX860_10730 [Agrobacterium leguminum]|uniref:DUF2946 family protein n=1 Tax=Agrobacterium TaxID=357 RepID=UPI00115E08DB|nr:MULTISPECIES: DUF2946 family protein [Agrobacterium]WLD96041.1 hypothetical protein PX860_10730 [Agrobacterium leguminum]
MIKRLGFAEQCIVRTLCALALLLVGFAHKPPVLANSQIPLREIAQYVLPDGTLPVLCLPSEDGKAKHDHHDIGSGCEACRLTASVLLPAPADALGLPILREAERVTPTRVEAFYRQLFPPNTSPRGPPSGLTA